MVDSVLLLVDAVDGPMPQTRFVTQKAFVHGLRPIVVINKIDRPEARPNWVLDQTFDLFDRLGATEAQLDFPVVYTSALQGFASHDPAHRGGDMTPLFEAVIRHCPPPEVDRGRAAAAAGLAARLLELCRRDRHRPDQARHAQAQHAGRRRRPCGRRARGARHAGARASSDSIASRSTRPRPATSWPSPGSSTRRSPIRSATRRSPSRCRRWSSTSRPSA